MSSINSDISDDLEDYFIYWRCLIPISWKL